MKTKAAQYAKYIYGIPTVIFLIFLDQFTKQLAISNLQNKDPFIVIKGVFQFHYLENKGAAFGLFQGGKTFFVISGIFILIAVAILYYKMPNDKKYMPARICLIMIVSGALGNMIDRLRLDYVVDFFYFELIDFPIFNVADIYVTLSTLGFMILILFYYKEEDLLFLSFKKKQ